MRKGIKKVKGTLRKGKSAVAKSASGKTGLISSRKSTFTPFCLSQDGRSPHGGRQSLRVCLLQDQTACASAVSTSRIPTEQGSFANPRGMDVPIGRLGIPSVLRFANLLRTLAHNDQNHRCSKRSRLILHPAHDADGPNSRRRPAGMFSGNCIVRSCRRHHLHPLSALRICCPDARDRFERGQTTAHMMDNGFGSLGGRVSSLCGS